MGPAKSGDVHEGDALTTGASLPPPNPAAYSSAGGPPPPPEGQTPGAPSDDGLAQPFEPLHSFVPPLPVIVETEHAARRQATAAAWAKLLPELVYPLMEWMHGQGGLSQPSSWCSCMGKEKELRVISFTSEFERPPLCSAFHNSIGFSNLQG
jgi:hypothetical protein